MATTISGRARPCQASRWPIISRQWPRRPRPGPQSSREENAMAKWQYTKGLHDLGGGCHAYLQPDGSWGWSNAGLIVDGDQTLLVDTLFDLRSTAAMLKAMRDAVPATQRIQKLVNTHANGDHTFGNQL